MDSTDGYKDTEKDGNGMSCCCQCGVIITDHRVAADLNGYVAALSTTGSY
jgi:hypothetical protein